MGGVNMKIRQDFIACLKNMDFSDKDIKKLFWFFDELSKANRAEKQKNQNLENI
jgi:hypothetical protein